MFDTETSTKRLAAIIRGTMYSDKHKDMARKRIEEIKQKPVDVTPQIKKAVWGKKTEGRSKFTLSIPQYGIVYMPIDVYEHKKYPACACGNKYVKTRKDQVKCIKCLYGKSVC